MNKKTAAVNAMATDGTHCDRVSDQAPGVGARPASTQATKNVPSNSQNRRQTTGGLTSQADG